MDFKQIFLTFFYLIVTLLTLVANTDTAPSFVLGNEAFQEGRFDEAIRHYQASLTAFHSAEQYFNLGNAYFKQEAYGKAIAYYLKAQTLSPNSSEIQNNLKLATEALQTSLPPTSLLKKIAQIRNVNAWSWLLMISFWITLGILILGKIYTFPYLTKNTLLFVSSLTLLVSSAALYHYHTQRNLGVIVKENASLKVAPTPSSPNITTLKEGSLANIKNTYDGDYYFIVLAERQDEGWVNQSDFVKIWN